MSQTLNILSWNINGIRSNVISKKKYKKGLQYSEIEPTSNLGDLITRYNPDIICMQETRCDEKISSCIKISGFYQYWSCSQGIGARSGARYSGVTTWTKIKPKNVYYTVPNLEEKEGRILITEFDSFILLNTYVPNSGTNFEYRIKVWDPAILNFLEKSKKEGKNVIWCGDLNVAPTEKDVHFGYKFNKVGERHSGYNKLQLSGTGVNAVAGFTKEERDNYEKFIDAGYKNVYKTLYPDKEWVFSWWNPRIPIFREKNFGWLIDHILVTEDMMDNVEDMEIIKDAGLLTKPQGSDHCAILLKLKK